MLVKASCPKSQGSTSCRVIGPKSWDCNSEVTETIKSVTSEGIFVIAISEHSACRQNRIQLRLEHFPFPPFHPNSHQRFPLILRYTSSKRTCPIYAANDLALDPKSGWPLSTLYYAGRYLLGKT